jgi:D-3-phosphoglycerate dehydrogenase
MFNAETIASMKDGACLINCARGALIDLDALADALLSGKLAGAGIDAFEVEPLPADAKILMCENLVLTPHTGAETAESYQRVSITAVKDIVRVLDGKEPEHLVKGLGIQMGLLR